MSAWEGSEWQRRQEAVAEERRREERQRRETTEAATREIQRQQERDQMDPLEAFMAAQEPPTVQQQQDRLEQIFNAILREGADGRMRLIAALCNPTNEDRKAILKERKLNSRFVTMLGFFERIESELDGTEDWTQSGSCPSRERFNAFMRDLRAARDLVRGDVHERLGAMQGIIREITDGVSAGHAPVVEDRTRR